MTKENEKLTQENNAIKKVVSEQQKCLERLQRNDSKNNIFISGIPDKLKADMTSIPNVGDEDDAIGDPEIIIHHILGFLHPTITKDCYKVVKNFDTRSGYTRHSAKIPVESLNTKTTLFKSCSKFKDIPPDHFLKKVFLNNDDPPTTRREKDRLYKKMKELRETEDRNNPVNTYQIKEGKLVKNGVDCIDEFNLCNQLFQ